MLTGPAVHLLDDDTDDLVDGDDIAKFRAALKKLGVPFHVEGPPSPTIPAGTPTAIRCPGRPRGSPRWRAARHALPRVLMAQRSSTSSSATPPPLAAPRDRGRTAGSPAPSVTVVLLDGAEAPALPRDVTVRRARGGRSRLPGPARPDLRQRSRHHLVTPSRVCPHRSPGQRSRYSSCHFIWIALQDALVGALASSRKPGKRHHPLVQVGEAHGERIHVRMCAPSGRARCPRRPSRSCSAPVRASSYLGISTTTSPCTIA